MKKLLLLSLCALFFSTITFAQPMDQVEKWDWSGSRGLPNDQLVKQEMIKNQMRDLVIEVDAYIGMPLYGTDRNGSPFNPDGSIAVWVSRKNPSTGTVSYHNIDAQIYKAPNSWEQYAGYVRPGRPLKKTIYITYKLELLYPEMIGQVSKFPPTIRF